MDFEKIEELVSALLGGIPNFIETDFVKNEDNTYTLSANFEHPAKDEDYCQQEFIFNKVTFTKDLQILESQSTIYWKENVNEE